MPPWPGGTALRPIPAGARPYAGALHAAVRVAAPWAPRWYRTPRPTVPTVGWCLQAADARASLAQDGACLQGNRWRCRLGTLTRRLLVELKNVEVGVSSSAASTGASFRGRAGGPTNAIARLRMSYTGRPRARSQLLLHGSFGGRAGARLTTHRTHTIKSRARVGPCFVSSNRKRRARPVAGSYLSLIVRSTTLKSSAPQDACVPRKHQPRTLAELRLGGPWASDRPDDRRVPLSVAKEWCHARTRASLLQVVLNSEPAVRPGAAIRTTMPSLPMAAAGDAGQR